MIHVHAQMESENLKIHFMAEYIEKCIILL